VRGPTAASSVLQWGTIVDATSVLSSSWRREHGIAEAAQDVPVGLFCFELLSANGEDLTQRPYPERRARLVEALTLSDRLRLTSAMEVAEPAALDAPFEQAVADGCEGLVCKAVGPESAYRAGARGWSWIKLKRDSVPSWPTRSTWSWSAPTPAAVGGPGRTARYCWPPTITRRAIPEPWGVAAPVLRRRPRGLARQTCAAATAGASSTGRLTRRGRRVVRARCGAGSAQRRADPVTQPHRRMGAPQWRRRAGMRFPRFTGRWRDEKEPQDTTTTTQWSSCSKRLTEDRSSPDR
jgi:DNA ligase 1